jgi:hypothetical protein
MTISELGSLGESLSSIGVLVTLIYLGIQITQTKRGLTENTAAIRGANEVSGNESSVAMSRSIFEDPEVARIVVAGAIDDPGLTDVNDLLRFDQYCHACVQLHQVTFMQWRRGILDDEYWEFCIRYQGRYRVGGTGAA